MTVPLPPARPYADPASNAVADAEVADPGTELTVEPEPTPPPEPPKQKAEAEAPARSPASETRAPLAPAQPSSEPAAAAAQSASARPPLADATIAATIRRIGYSCPAVTTTSPMEGEGAGATAFRITCSSGDAYRATVRQGRMRFRKL